MHLSGIDCALLNFYFSLLGKPIFLSAFSICLRSYSYQRNVGLSCSPLSVLLVASCTVSGYRKNRFALVGIFAMNVNKGKFGQGVFTLPRKEGFPQLLFALVGLFCRTPTTCQASSSTFALFVLSRFLPLCSF